MKRHTITDAQDLRRLEAQGERAYIDVDDVHGALTLVAQRWPDRPALTALAHADDRAPRRWTYAALLSDLRRTANALRHLAGNEAPRVVLLMPPLPEAWLALWGAEIAGVACPINHALDDDHLVALVNTTGAQLIITLAPGHAAGDIGTRVQRWRSRCPALRQVLGVGAALPSDWISFEQVCAQAPDAPPAPTANDGALASGVVALFHTGGTTGLPKLAQHTHRNQLFAAWGAAQLFDADEHDVILNGFPLFHVAGALVYGLSMLLSGAEVLLPPPAGWRDTAFVARAWAIARERGVSLMATVPTVMTALLAAPRGAADAAGLRLLLTGGSPLPNGLAHRFETETGVPVRNILGMTECAGLIAVEPAQAPRTAGSCGLPLPFVEVVADAHGVLRIRGPNVGPGYTDAARNPGTFDGEWLITGDIGHVDADGRVFVTGRAKDLIIRGAHNIDPAVIEDALLQHPAVALAAAVGEPDEYAGELPVAFVVAKPGADIDPISLLAEIAAHIPERAAIPKRLTVLPALPLTAIGKVYKPALRLLAAERVVRKRLATAGLAGEVTVHGEDRAGRIVMGLQTSADLDAMRLRITPLMDGFALDWQLQPACA